MNKDQLKDVVCNHCRRAIGQRVGSVLFQFGMKTKFNKTARIFCPFIGCGFEQDFAVNRDDGASTSIAPRLRAA